MINFLNCSADIHSCVLYHYMPYFTNTSVENPIVTCWRTVSEYCNLCISCSVCAICVPKKFSAQLFLHYHIVVLIFPVYHTYRAILFVWCRFLLVDNLKIKLLIGLCSSDLISWCYLSFFVFPVFSRLPCSRFVVYLGTFFEFTEFGSSY